MSDRSAALSILLGALLVILAIVDTSCAHCPKCPAPTPAAVVVERVPCMDPPPQLPTLLLPPPNPDGSITLPVTTARNLFLFLTTLRSYLEVQLTRCAGEKTP